MVEQTFLGKPTRQRAYKSFVEVYLDFGQDHSKATNYTKSLDMEKGMVTVEYDYDGNHYKRENFSSYPDQVVATHVAVSYTHLSETVTNIDMDAFNGCDNLTIYGIANSYAEKYANENGINFSALEEFIVENGVLIEYNGSGGDIVIPGNMGITSIGKYVFCNNQSITSVKIPDGIELIGDLSLIHI